VGDLFLDGNQIDWFDLHLFEHFEAFFILFHGLIDLFLCC
jgi:hypothetical protein